LESWKEKVEESENVRDTLKEISSSTLDRPGRGELGVRFAALYLDSLAKQLPREDAIEQVELFISETEKNPGLKSFDRKVGPAYLRATAEAYRRLLEITDEESLNHMKRAITYMTRITPSRPFVEQKEMREEIEGMMDRYLEVAEAKGKDCWRIPYFAFHRYRALEKDEQADRMLEWLVTDYPEEKDKVSHYLDRLDTEK